MRIKKQLQSVIDCAESLGFTVSRTRKNHLMFKRSDCRAVFCSGTPSDRRVTKNVVAELRRASIEGDSNETH